jgi:excisionase family DNA binding protein
VFTVKEAADRLNVSPALVYALCAEGKLAHERYGLGRGTIRISEEALEAYRRSCTITEAANSGAVVPASLKHIRLGQ